MTNFKILICEDDNSDRLNIELHIKNVNRNLTDYDITYHVTNFVEVINEINNEYDLLILDLYDSKSESDKGSQVLMHNSEKNKIPTIIYTSSGDDLEFDINSKKSEYTFLITKLTKFSNSGEELINFLKGYIITTQSHKFYELYNINDKKLDFSIQYIGETHFNYILYLFKNLNSISQKITVFPMTSGWSGAVLFKLQVQNDFYVLKLSKEIESLKTELENSKSLYAKFPSQLITTIFSIEYNSFDKTLFGFSIKNIDNSVTLLGFILSSSTITKSLETIFEEIFLKPNSLKDHYFKKTEGIKDWTAIFDKTNEGKIQWINDNNKLLKPIILKYYEAIDDDNFKRICIDHNYNNINSSKLLDDKYIKNLVLSHGDFHANNILIQNNIRPFIIDTGALGFQHWSSDISRLIISIFILGMDKDKVEYFDLNRLPYYIGLGVNIINCEPIDIQADDSNYNVIFSINWILKNVQDIYETQFSIFEFQLGLMKEFLQVSYRIETVPPSKRALALILADICLKKANENVVK